MSAFICYLLEQTASSQPAKRRQSTYIGVTCDLVRRLRQHCGEIQGGAKRTRGAQWRVVLWVEGFHTYTEALQFEWAFQKRRLSLLGAPPPSASRGAAVTAPPPVQSTMRLKLRRLHALTALPQWTRAAPPSSSRPLRIVCRDAPALHYLGSLENWAATVSVCPDENGRLHPGLVVA